jgi:hypothetical protein
VQSYRTSYKNDPIRPAILGAAFIGFMLHLARVGDGYPISPEDGPAEFVIRCEAYMD